MVGQETSLVAARAEVVDEEGARNVRLGGGIEASFEGREETSNVAI